MPLPPPRTVNQVLEVTSPKWAAPKCRLTAGSQVAMSTGRDPMRFCLLITVFSVSVALSCGRGLETWSVTPQTMSSGTGIILTPVGSCKGKSEARWRLRVRRPASLRGNEHFWCGCYVSEMPPGSSTNCVFSYCHDYPPALLLVCSCYRWAEAKGAKR